MNLKYDLDWHHLLELQSFKIEISKILKGKPVEINSSELTEDYEDLADTKKTVYIVDADQLIDMIVDLKKSQMTYQSLVAQLLKNSTMI